MIPLHPQRIADEPDALRWIIPAGTLSCTGAPADVPAPLAALLADGTLAGIAVEAGAVVTHLGAGRTWATDAAPVRTALHAALADPAGWVSGGGSGGFGGSGGSQGSGGVGGSRGSSEDALLRGVARDVLAGTVGDFARSHGGRIELVGVDDGVVTVRLGGACHGCPAAWRTLHQRLERELRRHHPGLVGVRDVGSR
ncbi:NifU family protein [Streptomyces sp. NPDC006997]|uniref:NifU family protein n=1 Tax=Streptomyces sp. NPDC006997 TaxID=3155356 RepID=UPI0033CCE4A2